MAEQKAEKKGTPTWLAVVGNVLIWIFVILAALMTILAFSSQKNNAGVGSLFGKVPVTILSDSMDPTFKQGDLIIDNAIKAEEKSKLPVDTVITFYTDLNGDGNDELNTHRIISVREEGGYTFYTTKGDNNTLADTTEIRYDQIVGRWAEPGKTGTKIGGFGKVMNFLQSPTGFLVCIVLPLVVFFLFEIYRFVVIIVSMKSKKISSDTEEEIKRAAVEEYLKNHANDQTADTASQDK